MPNIGCRADEAGPDSYRRPWGEPAHEGSSGKVRYPGATALLSAAQPTLAEEHNAAAEGVTLLPDLTTTRQAERTVEIAGEDFIVEHDEGAVFLRHPQWSLIGSGLTVQQAVMDMYREASELRGALARVPLARLDAEAERLLRFVLRL